MPLFLKNGKSSQGHSALESPQKSVSSQDNIQNNNKKKGLLKKIFKRRGRVPQWQKQKLNTSKYQDESDALTLVSPASSAQSSAMLNQYFSSPTEGFECILDTDDLQQKSNNKDPETGAFQRQISTLFTDAVNVSVDTVAVALNAAATTTPTSLTPAFNDWNSFVSALTCTNESIKTSMNDANETIKSFFFCEDPVSVSKKNNKTKSRDAPMNEVSFLPFDEDQLETGNEDNKADSQISKTDPDMIIIAKRNVEDDDNTEESGEEDNDTEIQTKEEIKQDHIDEEKGVNENNELTDADYGSPVTLPYEVPHLDKPVEEAYDSLFTLSFLKEISTVGMLLKYFKVPSGNRDDQDMTSSLVNLTIKPGLSRGSRLLEPRLYWSEVNNNTNASSSARQEYSISLLSIHSIHTSLNRGDDDQTQFFTITTERGDVHAFEASSIMERHHIVNGIRNIVAWLSYHLVMGNMASGTELVSDLDEVHGDQSGELPSLRTPSQAMGVLSHSFLD